MIVDDFDEAEDLVACPACEAEQPAAVAALGTLGRLIHLRCRFCGWQWSETADTETEE